MLVAGIIVNLIFFVMPAVHSYGNSLMPTRTIAVSAEGTTTVTPDLAEASFSVVSKGKNPTDLADTNNTKMSAVIQFLKSEGLEDKDIATTAYDLSPNYKYDESTQRNYITGYTLTQTVSVEMRDFKKVAEIVGGLTPLGVNQIGSVNFTVEEPEKFLAIARAQALQRAEAKAAEMAAENGLRLGEILNIGEYQTAPVSYYESARGYSGAAPAAVTPPTIEPGTQKISDQVSITYELK